MHSDLALPLSETKGELRFYKNKVLKDVLYYRAYAFIRVLPDYGRLSALTTAAAEPPLRESKAVPLRTFSTVIHSL